ncbi:MAG: hypothetical protein LAO30_10500 [Acidobacteriia bacterium]|nr:hypothetical protein [Terriglobia bacterium]
MCVTDNSEERLSIVQLNSELRHAELELLSAHCATYKLRLRFSAEHLARYGRRDVLRKSIETASALNEYYSSIEKQIVDEEAPPATPAGLTEKQIQQAIECVSSWLQAQRDYHLPSAAPLSQEHRQLMSPYFPADLLDNVRFVELHGARLPNPPFYAEAKAHGFVNLPDIAHMNSMTFLDVLVFNEKLTERSLFHALVHAVQFWVLGVDRYTELFVRNFVNTRFHFLVPVEAHAFLLESKFVRPAGEKFSVEDQVRLWAKQNRY